MKKFCIILFLCINLCYSQKLTLEQCIFYALKNNIEVKTSELNIKLAKINYFKSKLNLFPSLNFNANESFMVGRTIDPLTNEFAESNVTTTGFSINSSINLFSGFQNLKTIKQNYYTYKSAECDYEKVKNDLSITITSLYLQVLLATELYNNALKQKEISELQVEKNKIFFGTGLIQKNTYLESVSQFNDDNLQLVNCKNNLKMSQLLLIQALELDSIDTIEIDIPLKIEPDTSYINKSVNEIVETSLNNQQHLKSYYFKTHAASKAIEISKAERYPKLYISGSFATGYSSQRKNITNIIPSEPIITGFTYDNNGNIYNVYTNTFKYNYETIKFKNQLKDNISRSLSINLTIPIFNNWQVNNSIITAKINYKIYQYNYEKIKKQLIKDIQQAFYDYLFAYHKYKASELAYNATSEAYYLAEEKYNNGLISIYEYQISKNNFFKSKPELTKSKYELIFKQKILDLYCGKPIKL